ncbi:hypothetical protein [Donghicola sp. XS_ASV15]|uniref:hypothetical protein n=1 Tax=Donghicola sp. XS_ASV15 TaxID=3241295 RepID=UPI003516AD2B
MTEPAAEQSSQKIKYLEFIQAIITRMASESAAMKRYALAVTAAVNSTAAATDTWYLAMAGAPLLAVFWLLDGQYLTLERQYRGLYDIVRLPDTPADLSLKIPDEIAKQQTLGQSAFGWSVWTLYAALMLLCVLVAGAVMIVPGAAQ